MKIAFYLCVDNTAPEPTEEDRLALYDLFKERGLRYVVSYQELPENVSSVTPATAIHATLKKGLVMEYGTIKKVEDTYDD
jgi:hypothetical protein